jgi:monoamine oxidase
VKIKQEHNLPKQLLNDLPNNKEEIGKLQIALENISLENKKLKLLYSNQGKIMYEQQRNCSAGSTVHSFYQNMVLPESEQNIAILKNNIEELKAKIANLKELNTKLQKENDKLKVINARYKGLVYNQSNAHDVKGRRLYLDSRGVTWKFRRGTLQHEEDANSLIRNESITTGTKLIKDNAHLDLISNSLQHIAKASSIRVLIEILYQELDILLNRHKVGIFIMNPELQVMYRKDKGRSQIITVKKCIIELALHKDLL